MTDAGTTIPSGVGAIVVGHFPLSSGEWIPALSQAAHAVGYATPSAFLAAFRRTVGTTPRRYLNGDTAHGTAETTRT
ncbi:hypothetical protein LUW76_20970 [Actinomadura madurae]|uniref:hypothetical protein n=1 Tax=Actinomadura madurae TaxID=1993 RepID=UPI002025B9E2|nr:hypothetical protein [Actinomadura madurae]URM96605.1 hypothetical protein LUW76_20970 [Actinomadura madurae]